MHATHETPYKTALVRLLKARRDSRTELRLPTELLDLARQDADAKDMKPGAYFRLAIAEKISRSAIKARDIAARSARGSIFTDVVYCTACGGRSETGPRNRPVKCAKCKGTGHPSEETE